MPCPVCSEYLDASGGRLRPMRHIRNIHGYALKDADRLSRSATAPTASDPAAELAALRDEVRRLREALAEIHRIAMASYTPADATELHEAILPLLRAALEVTK